MRKLLTIFVLAAAAAATALGDDGDFQWQGQLSPGQLLDIRGVFGAIRAQGTADSTASLTAHKTAGAGDPAAVTIQVVPFDGGVVVCAVYPDANPNRPNTCNPPGSDNYTSVDPKNDVQVEFTIQVPPGVRLTASGQRGDIQAAGLTADVDATTLSGGISISTSGGAQASTLKGSITAAIGSVSWTGFRRFDTIDGNLDVQIPADASVSVRASALAGTVATDFPLVTRNASFGIGVATGTLGDGGRWLELSTNNGNISLRQGPAVH